MSTPFESLPDHSRIWIYQSDRKFNSHEVNIISEVLSAFTNEWNAHNIALRSSYDIRFNQFIIIAADENQQSASGCSIDDSVRVMKGLSQKLEVDFFNRKQIAFLKNDEVVTVPIEELKKQYDLGSWNQHSLVFNNLVVDKSQLKSAWIVPAESSWLKRYLPRETITVK